MNREMATKPSGYANIEVGEIKGNDMQWTDAAICC